MATTKRAKANIEFLLVKAELKGVSEKGLLAHPLTGKAIGSLTILVRA